MQYVELGNTGYKVSRLGFGAMRLPTVEFGDQNFVDIDTAVETIHAAFERGVNYIDTAFGYRNRESELAVGRALEGWQDKVTVATKASGGYIKKPGDLRRLLEHQLIRLNRDYLDFYLFHGIGWERFHDMDEATNWIADMQKAKEEGLIKHVGFSFHDDPENMIKLIDTGMFELVLCQYNYLDPGNEESIAYANSKGLGVVVMGPVGGGRLSVIPKNMRDADVLSENEAAELALRFVISNPNVHIALSGMGSVEMVKENVAAIDKGPLSEKEMETLDKLLEENKRLAELYCTGCAYCMPCPNEVNIPRNFELYNYYTVYGFEDYAVEQYARLVSREQDAGQCIECGTCLEECPQHIEIIEQLQEVVNLLAR
jgi:hypothetical protein